MLCRKGFSSSVFKAIAGATQAYGTKVYEQCLREWAGWCAQGGVPNNAMSVSKLVDFLFHLFRVGLAWHTVSICCSAI